MQEADNMTLEEQMNKTCDQVCQVKFVIQSFIWNDLQSQSNGLNFIFRCYFGGILAILLKAKH